jgi:hypothetical protein
LELFRAALEDEGSYDEAVAGCDYAFLFAAPVNYTAPNPEVENSSASSLFPSFDVMHGHGMINFSVDLVVTTVCSPSKVMEIIFCIWSL